MIPNSRFDEIAIILATEVQISLGAQRPRTYFILWQIKRLDAVESFIAKGLNDTSLPHTGRRTLPHTLTPEEVRDFLLWQDVVVSDVLHLEHGQHVTNDNGDVLFESKRHQLGVGSQGYVHRSVVLLPFCP